VSSAPQTSAGKVLERLDVRSWSGGSAAESADHVVDAIERSNVLYAPDLPFTLTADERRFLSPACLSEKSKNISFRPDSASLRGSSCQGSDLDDLTAMLRRYFESASSLVRGLLPSYADHIQSGFTTYRPAEISGRTTSWRHDDTRLHVDAFPSRPMRGWRILRVFANVHPEKPRVWRVGEPFEHVAGRFLSEISRPLPGSLWLLHLLRIVKGRRSEYDHFMLGVHDRMKADEGYQSTCPQSQLSFAPDTTWICFTDSVSHAAMSGQCAFEQTFYIPVSAMKTPDLSPLRILERMAGRRLI
jgi:hypothetical protein